MCEIERTCAFEFLFLKLPLHITFLCLAFGRNRTYDFPDGVMSLVVNINDDN